ncbi:DnaJ domain-containing protein [Neobacillus drentensis]|uniref:DnaJ domain-containing protein n=1 Tax=Neobacillus drentensis TaxID=220684 RepID=UPI002FFF5FC1
MFGWIVFWKVYFESRGSYRDEQLKKLHHYGVHSNLGTIAIPLLLMGFKVIGSGLGGFLIFCCIVQFIFQFQVCYNAAKRVLGIDSLRETFKEGFQELGMIAGAVTVSVASGLADEFKKIIDEFYGNYEKRAYSNQGQTYNQEKSHYQKQKETVEPEYNGRQSDEEKVKKIFQKHDIPENADQEIIKKCFRKLAKKYHPDMPTGDHKLFIELLDDMEFLKEYFENHKVA